ncbi:hypothetical protein FB45DRAFT_1117184 [Roridomyces roridus]|uniref:Uncharacterized protein n=1 Tax=Roridomyces roridus TaxID=1738132 RepID=A0AAD7B7S7_9AGAR|nr:hypothetical protein FB45DRAFT_1117184 [Roridomyces roridus]
MRFSLLYALGLAFKTFNADKRTSNSQLSARAPQALEGMLTNAQRLARGLPLLTPRRRSNFPRQSTPSSVPPVQVTCNIRVQPVYSAGPNGFLSNGIDYNGVFFRAQQSQNDGNALVVSFSYTPGSTSHFSMVASTPLYFDYPYMAAIISGDSPSNDLGSTLNRCLGVVYLGKSVDDLPEGTPPTPESANSYGGATMTTTTGMETALWSYDAATGALTPTWTNTNGQPVPAYLMYDSVGGELFPLPTVWIPGDPGFLDEFLISGKTFLISPDFPIIPDPVHFNALPRRSPVLPLCRGL